MSLNSFSSLKSSQHFFLKLINPDQRKAAECGNRSNVHGTYHDLVLGQVFGLSVCGLGFLTCHMRDTDWPPQPLPALTCDLWPATRAIQGITSWRQWVSSHSTKRNNGTIHRNGQRKGTAHSSWFGYSETELWAGSGLQFLFGYILYYHVLTKK